MTDISDMDDGAVGLAQALMAEITGRLEDLAAAACDCQLSASPSEPLEEGLRSVLLLVEAHRELLRPAEQAGESGKDPAIPAARRSSP